MTMTYLPWNNAGGQGKTSLTRDLAAGHVRAGDDVLVIDLDRQEGSLSNFLDVDGDKRNAEADDLSFHLVKQPKGSFDNLIKTTPEGIDVVPSHKRLEDLRENLRKAKEAYEIDGSEFHRHEQLLRVLTENDVNEKYDVIITDVSAKADYAFQLGLYAMRNLVIPVVPTHKGYGSIDDIQTIAKNMGDQHGIDIGLLAVIPTKVDTRRNLDKEYATKLADEYPAPTYLKSLGVFQDAEDNQNSVWAEIESADRVRASQKNVLPKLRYLVEYISEKAGHTTDPEWTGTDTWNPDDDSADFWQEATVASKTPTAKEVS